MQILEIDTGEEELLQGFVRAEWPRRADLVGGQAKAWIRMFLRSASLWSQAKPLSAAVRIAIEPGRPVTTVHSFVVARPDEQRLRLVLAAFMRTDQMGAGQTEAPERGMELIGRFIHPNEPRIGIAHETFKTANGHAIHLDLRLADRLPRLLQTFADLGVPFAYEIQATPWTPARERLKEFLRNLARLLDTPGLPPRLSEDQVALGERIKNGMFHVEECLSAPSQSLARTVREVLLGLLSETHYAKFGMLAAVESLEAARSEAFAHHVHSRLMLEAPAESVAELTHSTPREDVDRCLSCLPLGLGPDAGPPEPEPLALSLAPLPPTSPAGNGGLLHRPVTGGAEDSPFLFASYARADSQRVYPVVENLVKNGTSIWIDRHIMGGDDWVVELENRLLSCSGILAFVSRSFIGSKYCGRELRFGDALNKKIIPVFLEPTELSGGMNFILHAIQRVMLTDSTNLAAILSAIRAHAPAACGMD
jgi:hypothetical protein